VIGPQTGDREALFFGLVIVRYASSSRCILIALSLSCTIFPALRRVFLPMAPSCVVTPVAPSALRASGAAVTTVASVTVTLGRISFFLGKQFKHMKKIHRVDSEVIRGQNDMLFLYSINLKLK